MSYNQKIPNHNQQNEPDVFKYQFVVCFFFIMNWINDCKTLRNCSNLGIWNFFHLKLLILIMKVNFLHSNFSGYHLLLYEKKTCYYMGIYIVITEVKLQLQICRVRSNKFYARVDCAKICMWWGFGTDIHNVLVMFCYLSCKVLYLFWYPLG